MSQSLATVAYLGAAILFILSLGGLSNPETSRRGNLFGMVGMALAVLATVFGPRVDAGGIAWIVGALVVGGGIGLYAAKVVKMTQMPELVALMHSLVGLAACLVGFASYVDTSIELAGAEKAIHEVEIYVGILIGAVTRWSQAGAGAVQSQAAGPFSMTVDTRQRTGFNLWPSEITDLQAICKSGSESRGPFSVDTVTGGVSSHSTFCSVYFGGACSCGVDIAGAPIFEAGA